MALLPHEIVLLSGEFTFDTGTDPRRFLVSLASLYEAKAPVALHLQYHYVKRHILQMMLQGVWQDVTWSEGGVSESDGQTSANLQKLYDLETAEINKIEKQAAGARGGAMGVLTATAPISARVAPNTTGRPDANSRLYRGDPFSKR